MWIVQVALRRPYTFIVLALLLPLFGALTLFGSPGRNGMATDIFPDIGIPVIAVTFQYTGISPEEMAGRITSPIERYHPPPSSTMSSTRNRRLTPASRSSRCSFSRA
ncbi:MAG: efflux RND transporter permease subunit [Gammaproteobacteria bacterium]